MNPEELLEVIQVQRHDFLNHLQVISGLLQLNKIDRAREYLGLINREMERSSLTARVKIPEVTAVLLSALCESASYQIELEMKMNSSWEGLGIPGPLIGAALKKCLAAAFRVLSPIEVAERRLEVVFDENDKNYSCRLSFQKPCGFEQSLVEEELKKAEEIAGPSGCRVKLVFAEGKVEIFFIMPRKAM